MEPLAIILAVIATIIWGSQYILTKQGVATIPPFLFQGIRFIIAFVGFAPLWPRLRKSNWETIKGSFICAIPSYVLMSFLTIGLKYTTSAKGAFLASLCTVVTPFFAYLILKSKIKRINIIAVLISVLGAAIMEFGNVSNINAELGFNIGDVLIIIAAIVNGIQIVLFEKYVKSIDIILFSMYQMLFIGLMMMGTSWIVGETYQFSIATATTWLIWIYLGVVGGSVAMIIQAYVQRIIDSTRAALLFSLEPVFGAIFSVVLGNEIITYAFLIGAALIMLAIILSNVIKK